MSIFSFPPFSPPSPHYFMFVFRHFLLQFRRLSRLSTNLCGEQSKYRDLLCQRLPLGQCRLCGPEFSGLLNFHPKFESRVCCEGLYPQLQGRGECRRDVWVHWAPSRTLRFQVYVDIGSCDVRGPHLRLSAVRLFGCQFESQSSYSWSSAKL